MIPSPTTTPIVTPALPVAALAPDTDPAPAPATTPQFTFADGRTINRIGFGTMRLTGQPGNFGPYENWEHGLALLRRAVALGIDHIDTAHAYGPLHSERLIGEAYVALPEEAQPFIASKGGIRKTGVGPGHIRRDGRPDALKHQLEESLTALQRDRIDLYYLHAPDPMVPIGDSIGALLDAQRAGKIARIGVSNVTLAQLREAEAVARIDAVQNRFNALEDGDTALLDYTTRQGIAFVPWGPLGANPMQRGAPLARNGSDAALLGLLARAPNILPIPGTTTMAHLEENAQVLGDMSPTPDGIAPQPPQ